MYFHPLIYCYPSLILRSGRITYNSMSKSSLSFKQGQNFETAKVNLQVFTEVTCDWLAWTPGSASAVDAYPETRCDVKNARLLVIIQRKPKLA